MPEFGLIGSGISASQSPALFRAAYGGTLPYRLLDGGDFPALWRLFLSEYDAVNVTSPFKEDAFAQVLALARDGYAEISGPCFKTGATNLAVKTPEGIKAYNSDFSAVIMCVAQALFPGVVEQCMDLYGERAHIRVHQFVRENLPERHALKPVALVIGCGGAGRAAAVAAAEMGFTVALMNRTPGRASAIASSLPEYGFVVMPLQDLQASVREADLVIYTPPAAVEGLERLTARDFAGKTVLEASYKEPVLRDMPAVRESGCKYMGGLDWLLYQAAAGYPLMTGKMPDFKAMSGVLNK